MNMHLTELEEKLALPGGKLLQTQKVEELNATAFRLRQQLASGLPRPEFEFHQKAANAVQAALEVLQAWPVHSDTQSLASPFMLRQTSIVENEAKPHNPLPSPALRF